MIKILFGKSLEVYTLKWYSEPVFFVIFEPLGLFGDMAVIKQVILWGYETINSCKFTRWELKQ